MAKGRKGKGGIKGKIKMFAKPKVTPIKAGSTHRNDTGGIFNFKVSLISNKIRNG